MLRFTGVLVLLALAGQCADGQPTHDDSVLDGNELLEEMMTYLQHIIVHQEQQQRVQDERMERLEQMVNETANQLQQQQVEHQVIINQTCATTAEQSLQLLNNALNNISAQLVTIHDIQYGKWLMFHLWCFRYTQQSSEHITFWNSKYYHSIEPDIADNVVITCEVKLFLNYFNLCWRPSEIILFHVCKTVNLPEIIL